MERLLDCDGDPAMAPIQFCHGLWPPPAKKENFFSLHFPDFCDYFVKKVVYEIRKCHQLHADVDPLKFRLHVERVTMSAREYNGQGQGHHYMLAQTWPHARHVV